MSNINSIILDYFPLTVATGQSFCNREEEIVRLKGYIVNCRPTLLVSPRRYGKTSLALHTINKMNNPFAQIDLFSAVEEQDIERIILKAVGKLLFQIESAPKKALSLASEIFTSPHIKASLGGVEVSLEISRRKEKPAYHVLDILERLENLAKKSQQKIILFFDEFQRIGEVTPNQAMESVLRQVAQLTKSISFIFSGSNRSLLNQLFEDRNRPFYKLCERISLDRISAEAYQKHIQRAAQKTWKTNLSDRIFERLFWYTERHSYYVNLLCSRIWLGDVPTVELIDDTWDQYVKEEKSNVASEMDLLSKNQRKLLTILARTDGTDSPLGREFILRANMSKTTIEQSLGFLEKKDYVYKDETGKFQVLDPLIKAVLSA